MDRGELGRFLFTAENWLFCRLCGLK
jgi:hypothetical protein